MAAVNPSETKDGYKKLKLRRNEIIDYLASQKTAKKLASKLFGAEVITRTVYDRANNYAANVVETDRVTVMFDAVLAGVKLKPLNYSKFLSILKEIEGLGDIIDAPLIKKVNDTVIENISDSAREEEKRKEKEKKAREEKERKEKEKKVREEENTNMKEKREEEERKEARKEHFTWRLLIVIVVGLFGVIVMAGMVRHLSQPDPSLTVTIQVYQPPPKFALEPPYYRVASSVILTCYAHGATGYVTYSWYSNCTGDCFMKEEKNQSISTRILQPAHTGNYTCVATQCDWQDCNATASASIEMQIVGTGIFDERANKALPENGILSTSQDIHFYCWFSAVDNDTAIQFIDVSGTDIASGESPFNITTTAYGDTAVMEIVARSLSLSAQGMYTCRLNQPNGNIDMNVGIYQSETTPIVTSLQQNTSADVFTLVCVSTGSPPTDVIWTKDGVRITVDGTVYRLTQTIANRSTSTFSNILEINESVNKLPGDYSCSVNNSLGVSNAVTIMEKVMQITGHEEVFIVGLTAHISCTTNLKDHVNIQWLFGDFDVLESSTTQEVVLHRKLEPNDIYGPKFICRIVGSDDTVYREVITLKVKDLENVVTIDAPTMPLIAGNAYSISCIARTDVQGAVEWVDSTGSSVMRNSDLSVDDPIITGNKTTLTLHLNPLRTSHGGEYTCVSSVDILQSVKRASTDIIVEIPIPAISVSQSPENTIYTTSNLNLICDIAVNEAVDTPVDISSLWSGPMGILNSSGNISVVTTFDVFEQRETVVATLESLTSSDTGSYICNASVSPNSPSAYIVTSNESSSEPLNVTITLKVSIQVNCIPPVDDCFHSQLYRAGSQVTLHCHVEGATGPVAYRWTSTCSDCFVSGTSSYVTSNFLRSIDAGLHTCTVTDSIGIEGSRTIPMNITGAGVYVLTGTPHGLISNNSVIVAKHPSQILQFYCVSNSTKSGVGKLIGIGGRDITLDNYDAFDVTHYNPGGIQITSPYSHQEQYSCNCDHYHCHMSSNQTSTIRVAASTQGWYSSQYLQPLTMPSTVAK